MKKRFVVWYNPYNLESGEEDFVVIEAKNKKEAGERAKAYGWVLEVNEVDETLDCMGWC